MKDLLFQFCFYVTCRTELADYCLGTELGDEIRRSPLKVTRLKYIRRNCPCSFLMLLDLFIAEKLRLLLLCNTTANDKTKLKALMFQFSFFNMCLTDQHFGKLFRKRENLKIKLNFQKWCQEVKNYRPITITNIPLQKFLNYCFMSLF